MPEATCELSIASAVTCPCVAVEDWGRWSRTRWWCCSRGESGLVPESSDTCIGQWCGMVVEKCGLLSAKCVECQVFEECQVSTTRLHSHLLSDSSSLQCQEALHPHPAPALLHLPPVLLLQGRQGAHHLAHLRARAELL